MIINDKEFSLEYLDGKYRGVAVCSLTRPESMNAISRNLKDQFQKSVDKLKFADDIRVAIIRSGVPGLFCAGADLKERLTFREDEVEPFVLSLRKLAQDLWALPMPTIAAIDGPALGGGLEYALCCDIRIATNDAKLGLTETKLGIMPGAGGTQTLVRTVGPAYAKEMIHTGKALTGQQAKDIKLVNHVVLQNTTGSAAYLKSLEVAMEILPNGPIAVRQAKQAINRGIQVDINSGLGLEQLCYAQVIPTRDRLEGIEAFREKRPPRYTGE